MSIGVPPGEQAVHDFRAAHDHGTHLLVVGGFGILREAHHAMEEARARGDTALDPEQLEKLRQRYDEAATFGIDAIRAALKEKPWLPPLPALA